jgi:Ca-activated chloride channel homolog
VRTGRSTRALSILILAAAPVLATGAAAAQEGPAGTDDPGTGILLARIGGALVPLPAISMSAELTVSGPMVRAVVRQSFRNDTLSPLEGLYVFPLPEGATVDGVTLEVGGRRYAGHIEEKEDAHKIYEQAKAEGKSAGLVEQHRPNLFRTSVANVPPGQTLEVELRYLGEAEWESGTFSLTFQMAITRRYAPAGSAPAPVSPGVVPGLALHVALEAGVPLAEVVSPSHAIHLSRDRDTTSITVGDGSVPADRDFVLRWRPATGTAPLAGALVENGPEGRYALAMLVPPDVDGPRRPEIPTQTVFVIDVSGSMEGPSIAQAKAALGSALDRLGPADAFTLIEFADTDAAFSERLLTADPVSIRAAHAWVDGLEISGGTEILPALLHALKISESGDNSVLKRVVLITDGAVGNEEEVFRAVEDHLGGTRLHVVGIGPAPNRWLMTELARAGRGTFESIGSLAEVGTRTADLLARTERAVMTDVALEWDGVAPLAAYPDPVPDLYAGRPLLVVAKLDPSKPPPRLRVWGRAAGGPITMQTDLHEAASGSGIATRWARAKIASLEAARMHGADPRAVKTDVIDVSKRFSIVSPYTSFVIVADRDAADAADQSAGDLPQGGTLEPLLLALALFLTASGGALLVEAHRRLRVTA